MAHSAPRIKVRVINVESLAGFMSQHWWRVPSLVTKKNPNRSLWRVGASVECRIGRALRVGGGRAPRTDGRFAIGALVPSLQ
jgi:hypothetical protein